MHFMVQKGFKTKECKEVLKHEKYALQDMDAHIMCMSQFMDN